MKFLSFATTALAGAAAIFACTSVQAQPDDWSGIHVGVNGGWRSQSSRVDPSTTTVNQLSGVNNGGGIVTVPSTTFTAGGDRYRTSAGTWGGQVGADKQMGSWVLGFEGDMNALYGRRSRTNTSSLAATGLTSANSVTLTRSVDPHWQASLRGRVGWAMGPGLIYGTGGIAFTEIRDSAAFVYSPTVTGAVTTANPGSAFGPYNSASSVTTMRTGWTVGGGGEWMVSPHFSVGAEYRHSDFGHATYAFGANGPNSVSGLSRIGDRDDAVTARVNYHFGGGS